MPCSYYDLILGYWLEVFLQKIYTAFTELKYLNYGVEKQDELSFVKTYEHFWKLSICEKWHKEIQNLIKNVIKPYTHFNLKLNNSNITLQYETDNCKKRLGDLIKTLLTKDSKVLFSHIDNRLKPFKFYFIFWQWRSWATWKNLSCTEKFVIRPDWNWRLNQLILKSKTDSRFGNIAQSLIYLYLPSEFLEGFSQLRKFSLNYRKKRPDVLFTSSGLHESSVFRVLAAEWREMGTKIIVHQHGGGYGLEKKLTVENYEIRNSHKFFSWGWISKSSKVSPLSPPIEKKLFKKIKYDTGFIYLNCVDFPKVPYKLHFAPMPGSIQVMHKQTKDFLLHIVNKKKIIIRPYPFNYNWGFTKSLQKIAPQASIDKTCKGDIHRYYKASLVIHNYIGTSWLETLSFEIPTICFFDSNTVKIRAEAQKTIQSLYKVGILHKSGKKAALFASKVNIKKWWLSPSVTEARKKFCLKYARVSLDWKNEWENNLCPFIKSNK